MHQSVQRGLLRAVELVVERGAILCPFRLPADGLHAGLQKGESARSQVFRRASILLSAARRCVASNRCLDGSDRQLWGGEIRTADVFSGS